MTATLSELVAERRDLADAAAENDGVIEESLEALWEENDAAVQDKIEAWGHHLRVLASDIDTLDAEIKRLQDRRRARTNEYDRRRDFLRSQMEFLGIEKVDRPLITVAVQTNPPCVRVSLSPEHLPVELRREIPARVEADKKAILALHKMGGALPEGVSVEQTKSLQIR